MALPDTANGFDHTDFGFTKRTGPDDGIPFPTLLTHSVFDANRVVC